jgi:zinc protease
MCVAVVVSVGTAAAWPRVLAALEHKHCAFGVTTVVISSAESVDSDETTSALRHLTSLRNVVFVARWHECGEAYVRAIHRLTRGLDPTHPFSDVVWGVITAHDEAGAVTIAEETEPLAVRRVVSGTVEGVDLRAFQSGVAFNELVQRHGVVKVGPTVDDGSDAAGGVDVDVVSDATMAIKQEIEHPETDMIITSGHARESEWNIGFRFPGGQFRPSHETGALHAHPVGHAIGPDAIQPHNSSAVGAVDDRGEDDDDGDSIGREINAAGKRKVYCAAGNCLMGHVNSDRSMALAWFKSCGVRQMVGYTVPTWFGFAGWGVHRYLWANVGALTFAEAYFANQQALQLRMLELCAVGDHTHEDPTPPTRAQWNPSELDGLLFDSDATVFFGDPSWEARMVPTGTPSGRDFYAIEVIENSENPVDVNVEVRITTLRPGCWTATCADDKTTLPGRPPFALRPPGPSYGSHISLSDDTGIIVTPVFVLVPLTGSFEAGQVIVRKVTLKSA